MQTEILPFTRAELNEILWGLLARGEELERRKGSPAHCLLDDRARLAAVETATLKAEAFLQRLD